MVAVATDLVADAANRSNEGAVVTRIHLAAKIVDVHVHDVRHGAKIEFPDLLDNGRAGNGLALVPHQEFKQSEFLATEIDVVTSAAHGAIDTVDCEIFDLENRAGVAASSAQNAANARGKFGKGEVLCEVIIRAGTESATALLQHART